MNDQSIAQPAHAGEQLSSIGPEPERDITRRLLPSGGSAPTGEALPPVRALYVHVPFCPQVCPYCDFHKMRRHAGLVAQYVSRIVKEIEHLNAEGRLDTVYFGGGTPSHLTDTELERIIAAIDRRFGWPAAIETTLEADPLTFDRRRAEHWAAMGINRLSIGVQSLQNDVLSFLGRGHQARDAVAAVEAGLAAGLEVSGDVITAVPGQDPRQDLVGLAELGVQHLSVYGLTIEPRTPFGFRGLKVDPDQDADDFELAARLLPAYGLERYEVSNYARSGFESDHNRVYWRGELFFGVGPRAAGFVRSRPLERDERRTAQGTSPDSGAWERMAAERDESPTGLARALGYRVTNPTMRGWLGGAPPEVEPIGPQRYVEDTLMTGLRTRQGVDLGLLLRRSGIDVAREYAEPLQHLRNEGLLRLDEEGDAHVLDAGVTKVRHLCATESGLMTLNQVVARLLL